MKRKNLFPLSISYKETKLHLLLCVAFIILLWIIFYYLNIFNLNAINKLSINILPNPLTSNATLKSDVPLKNATLSFYNNYGQQVIQMKQINGHSVELSRENLISGIYFIKVSEEKKIMAVKKIVIVD